MQTSVEQLENLKCRMTVVVPADQVEEAYKSQLKEIAKTARIDGFRPGKAPMEVIDKKYGSSVRKDVVQKTIQDTFLKAIDQNHLKIAGNPSVEPADWKRGEALQYIVNFETFPEIKLVGLDGQAVDKVEAEVVDEDIDEMLKNVQKQFAVWQEVDRASANGDKIIIDFEGFIDGEAFEGGKAERFALELGSNSMIPGFEEGVVGLKAGESKDITVTFPADYPKEELAGKPAVFKITAHSVEEAQLPELDDSLAAKAGIEGGIEALRGEVRKQMTLELERILVSRNKTAVLDKLMALNEVSLPASLVEIEIKHLKEMMLQQMANQRGQKEAPKMDLPREIFVEQAERRVKLGLLLSEVIKQHGLKVDDQRVKSKVTELASAYQKPEEVVSWYYGNKEMLAEIEAVVLEDDAVAKLTDEAEVKITHLSYKEAIKPTGNE